MTERSHAVIAAVLLHAATVIWGSTFLIVQVAQREITPAWLMAVRFTIAAVILAPFLRRQRGQLLAAIELGILLFAGFYTQSIGLLHTNIARSAFITSMAVILVPLLALVWGRPAPARVWAAAIFACVGAALLCYDGSPPNVGDLWTVACAFLFAAYILRLQMHLQDSGLPPVSLAAAHIPVVAALSYAVAWADPVGPVVDHGLAIAYLAIAATVGTTLLQFWGQRRVSAAGAAVIYTLEPVWALVFGAIFAGVIPGMQGLVGAGIIVAAAMAAQRLPKAGCSREGGKSSARVADSA